MRAATASSHRPEALEIPDGPIVVEIVAQGGGSMKPGAIVFSRIAAPIHSGVSAWRRT